MDIWNLFLFPTIIFCYPANRLLISRIVYRMVRIEKIEGFDILFYKFLQFTSLTSLSMTTLLIVSSVTEKAKKKKEKNKLPSILVIFTRNWNMKFGHTSNFFFGVIEFSDE